MSYSFSSGWCTQCGRRRGDDGRCTNCDPWWTSGLIQVGAPLVAGTAALLVIFIASVGGRRPEAIPRRTAMPRVQLSPGSPVAPSVATSALLPSAPGAPFVANPASVPMQPAPPSGAGWHSPKVVALSVDPERRRWSELEQLRSLVWAAEASERGSRIEGRHARDYAYGVGAAPTTYATSAVPAYSN
jgi:hypothetical protein